MLRLLNFGGSLGSLVPWFVGAGEVPALGFSVQAITHLAEAGGRVQYNPGSSCTTSGSVGNCRTR